MEPYSGNPFVYLELVPSEKRYIGVRFDAQSMGMIFNWTLNQEMLFSSALTGKPVRKEAFSEYRWRCCVIGTRNDYVMATTHKEWVQCLQIGNLWELKNRCDETMVLAPANNTEDNHVSAYLEASWGYLWPAACHNFSPQTGEWSAAKHSGLKEFVDHVIIQMGKQASQTDD